MKRIGLMIAAFLVAAAMGNLFHRTDVGKLQPVQVIYISREQGQVAVSTDTGGSGAGKELAEAFAELRKSASGAVFLDTADYLLLDPDCMGLLKDNYEILRPGTRVCIVEGAVDVDTVGEYLSAHRPKVTLAQCRAGEKNIPILIIRGGRMELAGESN